MRTIYKLAKLILACFMFITCVSFTIVQAEDDIASSQLSQDALETVNEEESAEKKFDINTVSDTDVLTAVPLERMIIKNGVFYGISEEWYESTFPQIKVSLMILETVMTIANDAFQSNYTNAKNHSSAFTKSEFDVVSIDFTNAMNLTRINTQAAMNCTSLTGLLDLSHSKVTYIGKSTFNGCTNLTGVFFPSSLKYTGDQEGGSVFKDCTDLQFVRVTSKNNDAAFELPDTLESIGY